MKKFKKNQVHELYNNEKLKIQKLLNSIQIEKLKNFQKLINFSIKAIKTKGCGTETLRLLQDYAFNKLNLNSIWTGVSERNIASIKSNLKAGMKKVGNFPESIFYSGKLVNMICFCITKKQFKKIK